MNRRSTKAMCASLAATFCLLVSSVAGAATYSVSTAGIPTAVVPDGWGVNIHFTHFTPQGLAMFQKSGFHVARMDMTWDGVEQTAGVYDFSQYDQLVADLASAHARPLFILDYGNHNYDGGVGPYTDAGRAAFARYAAAAAAHFKKSHVIWEIWNEPNLAQWLPKTDPNNWKANSNVDSYINLVKAAVPAILKADPNATVMAGCTCRLPLQYIEAILRSGAMKGCSAFSVHPYRDINPETAASDYNDVRALIARYTPLGQKPLPLVSSEWGYSSATVSEQKQAAFIVREYLGNVAAGVDTSIFYDWQNDGPNASNPEWRYGTITQDYQPKPAYLAVQSMVSSLRGYRFCHRLKTASNTDYKLLFEGASGLATVEWTATDTDANPPLPAIRKISPNDPEYKQLKYAASIAFTPETRVALTSSKVPITVTLSNPSDAPATIGVKSGAARQSFQIPPHATVIKSVSAMVDTSLSGVHPMSLAFTWNGTPVSSIMPPDAMTASEFTLAPSAKGTNLAVAVTNPLQRPFIGQVVYRSASGKSITRPLTLAPQAAKTVVFSNLASRPGKLEVLDASGAIYARGATYRYVADAGWPTATTDQTLYAVVSYLDNQAKSHDPAAVAAMDADAPASVAIAVPYANEAAWRYDTLEPVANDPIPAGAKSISVWVKGDGSGVEYRARFLDDSGQTFQPEGGLMNDPGWHLVTLALDGSTGIHWGGANDGVPHGQRYWSDFVLIDGHGGLLPDHTGTMYIAAPTYAFP